MKSWGFTAVIVVLAAGALAVCGAYSDDHNSASLSAEETLISGGFDVVKVVAPWRFFGYNEDRGDVEIPFSQRNLKYHPVRGGYADIRKILPAEEIDPLHELPTEPPVCVARFGLWYEDPDGWQLLPDSGEVVSGPCPYDLNELLIP